MNGRKPPAPEFVLRAAPDDPNERELLLGAVDLSAFEPAKLRFPELLNSPPRAAVPALDLPFEPENPPRDDANPVFEARAPAENPFTWFSAIVCCRCDCSCWNDAGRATLLFDPKKRSEPPLRIVEGAAARPLADKLARDGTTGRFPAIMRAPPICARVAATALTRPAPKRPAPTVDKAPPICGS